MIEKTPENIKYYKKLFEENQILYGCAYYNLCYSHDCPCNLSIDPKEYIFDFDRYNEVRKSLEEEREEIIKEYNNDNFNLELFLSEIEENKYE